MISPVGVCFVSTGGYKAIRAARSFHRMEPELPIHVQIDRSTKHYQQNKLPLDDVVVADIIFKSLESNPSHVNGAMNSAMRWMKEFGYSHVCLFHDDLIFSPLEANLRYFTRTFEQLFSRCDALREASGYSFGHLESHVHTLGGSRAPTDWDALDLETHDLWNVLCPRGVPARTASTEHFFVGYEESAGPLARCTRLGPTGQVVPVATWESVGGFDETFGTHYDGDYPAACIVAGLPPVLSIPNTPVLHLHTQTVGFGDPVTGIWTDVTHAFEQKYGANPGEFWKARGYL